MGGGTGSLENNLDEFSENKLYNPKKGLSVDYNIYNGIKNIARDVIYSIKEFYKNIKK
jgi:hypothetical protein